MGSGRTGCLFASCRIDGRSGLDLGVPKYYVSGARLLWAGWKTATTPVGAGHGVWCSKGTPRALGPWFPRVAGAGTGLTAEVEPPPPDVELIDRSLIN